MAIEYGWSPEDILTGVYPDEVLPYLKNAKKRYFEEKLLDLSIAQNPHSKKPKELFRQLKMELRKLDYDFGTEKLDKQGFERLKGKMKKYKNSKIKVK